VLQPRQERGPFAGQVHLAAVTPEQRSRQVFLECSDLETCGARSDPERIGGAGKAQVIGDRNEHAQAAQGQSAQCGVAGRACSPTGTPGWDTFTVRDRSALPGGIARVLPMVGAQRRPIQLRHRRIDRLRDAALPGG
jgi:hypothetical protein